MDNLPLVSVILPVYNVALYLPECLTSLKNQTYENYEVIVVNDGATDNSLDICNDLLKDDNRFKIFSKENGGLSDARNYGMEKASGEYFTFIDSDDYVTNDYIEYHYNLIKKSNSKISVAAHTIFYENGTKIYKGIKKDCVLTQKEALDSILLDNGVDLSAWNKMYSADLFNNIKYPKGVMFEDTATTYKLFYQVDSIAVGSESKLFYRIRKNSITTCGNFLKKMDLIYNTDIMCDSIIAKYPDLINSAQRRQVWAYFSTLNQLIKCKNIKDYKNEYLKIKNFLNSKKKDIIFKKEYSKRDKMAMICFSFGIHFYKLSWGFYQKITSKI